MCCPERMVATLLWWLANVLFGFYVRQVPYSVVYGGLAAVIGLLIWMQVSTRHYFSWARLGTRNWPKAAKNSKAFPPEPLSQGSFLPPSSARLFAEGADGCRPEHFRPSTRIPNVDTKIISSV